MKHKKKQKSTLAKVKRRREKQRETKDGGKRKVNAKKETKGREGPISYTQAFAKHSRERHPCPPVPGQLCQPPPTNLPSQPKSLSALLAPRLPKQCRRTKRRGRCQGPADGAIHAHKVGYQGKCEGKDHSAHFYAGAL